MCCRIFAMLSGAAALFAVSVSPCSAQGLARLRLKTVGASIIKGAVPVAMSVTITGPGYGRPELQAPAGETLVAVKMRGTIPQPINVSFFVDCFLAEFELQSGTPAEPRRSDALRSYGPAETPPEWIAQPTNLPGGSMRKLIRGTLKAQEEIFVEAVFRIPDSVAEISVRLEDGIPGLTIGRVTIPGRMRTIGPRAEAKKLAPPAALARPGIGSVTGAGATSQAAPLSELANAIAAMGRGLVFISGTWTRKPLSLFERSSSKPSTQGEVSDKAQDFFDRFFKDMPPDRGEFQGSGVLADAAGHVVTAYGVLADSDSIVVTSPDGRSSRAELVGFDEAADVALLRTRESLGDVTPASLSAAPSPATGEWVMGLGRSSPAGYILTLDTVRSAGEFLRLNTVQVAYGAAVCNMKGELLGLATLPKAASGGSPGAATQSAGAHVVAAPLLRQLIADLRGGKRAKLVARAPAKPQAGSAGPSLQSEDSLAPASAQELRSQMLLDPKAEPPRLAARGIQLIRAKTRCLIREGLPRPKRETLALAWGGQISIDGTGMIRKHSGYLYYEKGMDNKVPVVIDGITYTLEMEGPEDRIMGYDDKSREPLIGVGSVLRFDPQDWVRFSGNKYRKGGVEITSDGFQFLAGTQRGEEGAVRVFDGTTWREDK